MTLPDRIKTIRAALGLSQRDMSKAIGIAFHSWQVYEKGSSVPGGNILEALVRMGFNANWILTGEGNMRHDDPTPSPLGAEWTKVPQYNARLSAGPGSFIENGGSEEVGSFTFKTSWLTRKCQPKQCGCFRVSGDSMVPVIQDGDVVLVDMGQNDLREVREGKIYAFSEGELIRVKRLSYKGSGELWAISDNKQASPDSPIDMATFALIGRVIWVGHEVW